MSHPAVFAALLAAVCVGAVSPCRAGSLSPDGKWLAYAVPRWGAEAEAMTELRLAPTAGGGETRKVTELPGFLAEIHWLGEDRIALSEAARPQRLRVVTPAGARLPDIALPPGYSGGGPLVPSPDGRYLAFTGIHSQQTGEQRGVFVCDVAEGKARCLIECSLPGSLSRPAWSPDSRRLAVGIPGQGTARPELTIVDVETGTAKDTGAAGGGAAWSPDGRTIACSAGVPGEARLGLYDVAAGWMQVLAGTEKAVRPTWSPAGTWVAYDTWLGGGVSITQPGDMPAAIRGMRDMEFVLDLAWLDEQTLFLRSDHRVARSDRAATWHRVDECSLGNPPQPSPADHHALDLPRVAIRYAWLSPRQAEAYGQIVAEGIRQFEEMGFAMPAKVALTVRVKPQGGAWWLAGTLPMTWGDGDAAIALDLGSKETAAPAGIAGRHVLTSLHRHLAAMALYRGLGSPLGLVGDTAAGWCDYLGSLGGARVTRSLGDAIWPEPCDVLPPGETGSIRSTVERWVARPWEQVPANYRTLTALYRLGEEHGHDRVMAAMARALAAHPIGKDLMPATLEQLRGLSGDAKAGDWIPPGAWAPVFRHPASAPVLDDGFFAGRKAERDGTGVTLSYDDGTRESSGASSLGCTTLFRAPKGAWQLDAVRVFASRLAVLENPGGRFSVCVCDAELNLIREFRFPVGLFGAGEGNWADLKLDAVDVPETFAVCIEAPTGILEMASDLYVGRDEGVPTSHSRYARPYLGESGDEKKPLEGDFMIRPHLRPKPLGER